MQNRSDNNRGLIEHLEMNEGVRKEKRIEKILTIIPNSTSPKLKEKPTMSKIPEPSILSRLQNFLPELKQSNRCLLEGINETNRERLNLEVLENEENFIEMSLGLGILEPVQTDQDEVNESNIIIPEKIDLNTYTKANVVNDLNNKESFIEQSPSMRKKKVKIEEIK